MHLLGQLRWRSGKTLIAVVDALAKMQLPTMNSEPMETTLSNRVVEGTQTTYARLSSVGHIVVLALRSVGPKGGSHPEIWTEGFPKKARATSAFMNKRLSPKIAQSANRASFCGSRSLCGCAFLDLWFARFRKIRGVGFLGASCFWRTSPFWPSICGGK